MCSFRCRLSLQTWPARKASGPERHPFESAEPITTLSTPKHPESGIYATFAIPSLHPGVNRYANVAITTFLTNLHMSKFRANPFFLKQVIWPRDETCACREIKLISHLWVLPISLHSHSFWNWASVGNASFVTCLRSYRHTQLLNSLRRELRQSPQLVP